MDSNPGSETMWSYHKDWLSNKEMLPIGFNTCRTTLVSLPKYLLLQCHDLGEQHHSIHIPSLDFKCIQILLTIKPCPMQYTGNWNMMQYIYSEFGVNATTCHGSQTNLIPEFLYFSLRDHVFPDYFIALLNSNSQIVTLKNGHCN